MVSLFLVYPVSQLIITLLVIVGYICVLYSGNNTLVCFTWFLTVDIKPVSS